MKRALFMLCLAVAAVSVCGWFCFPRYFRFGTPQPNWRFLNGFHRSPGVVSGWVLRTNSGLWKPITGTTVMLWDRRAPWDGVWNESTELLGRTTTIADGSFRFPGVEYGQYLVTAKIDGCTRRMRTAVSADRAGSARVFFGTSGVHGTVHDAEGRPMPGAFVTLIFTGDHSYYLDQESHEVTDAEGNYHIDGFPDGTSKLTVSATPSAPAIWPWPQQEITLTLAAGETTQVDVGRNQRLARWYGVLRATPGTHVQTTSAILLFDRRSSGAATGEWPIHIETRVGDSGKFEVRLPPGTWTPSVQFWYPTPQTLELPPQTVGTEDVRDMVLTGLRLHGTLLDSVTHDPRQTRLTARRKVTASQPDPFVCWADQTKEGYDFERIPAGDWILTAAPLRLAATGGEVQLHVEADEAERRLDLEVQAP